MFSFIHRKNVLWYEMFSFIPETGLTHQSLINLIVSTRMWWLSLYGLKNTQVWSLSLTVQTGQGPSANWSLDCVFLMSLVIGYNLLCGWWRDFPVVSGKIIYRKIRFPRNFQYSPTLGVTTKYNMLSNNKQGNNKKIKENNNDNNKNNNNKHKNNNYINNNFNSSLKECQCLNLTFAKVVVKI